MKQMTKYALEDTIKEFVSERLISARNTDSKQTLQNLWGQAYGVIQFSCNELFDEYNEDLAKWYEENIWKQFRELEFRCI